jgi:hypothetical protein
MLRWSIDHATRLHFIALGTPVQNTFVKIFEARENIEAWAARLQHRTAARIARNQTPQEFVRGLINQQLPPLSRAITRGLRSVQQLLHPDVKNLVEPLPAS